MRNTSKLFAAMVACGLLVGCGGEGGNQELSTIRLIDTNFALSGSGGYQGSTAPMDTATATVNIQPEVMTLTFTNGDRIMQIDLPVTHLVEGMRFTSQDDRVAAYYFDPAAFIAPDSRLNSENSFSSSNVILEVRKENNELTLHPDFPWQFSKTGLGTVTLSQLVATDLLLPQAVVFSRLNTVFFKGSESNFGFTNGTGSTGILTTGSEHKIVFTLDSTRELEISWPSTQGTFEISNISSAKVAVRQDFGNGVRVWRGTGGVIETVRNDQFDRDWTVSLNNVELSPEGISGATGMMSVTGAVNGQSPID